MTEVLEAPQEQPTPETPENRKARRLITRFQELEARAQPLIEASRQGKWRLGKQGWEIIAEDGTVLWSEKEAPVGHYAL